MISALQRDETDGILKSLYKKAKPGEWKFKSQEVTNLSLDERAHEIVREKVFKYFSKVFRVVLHFYCIASSVRLDDAGQGMERWSVLRNDFRAGRSAAESAASD